MSRSPTEVQTQAVLAMSAANFVRWADEWIRPRVERSSLRFDQVLSGPKRLVRVAANSPARVERSYGRLLVRFSTLNGFDGVLIRPSSVAGHQLPLPLFTNDHFRTPERFAL